MRAIPSKRSILRPTPQGWGIACASGLFLSSLLWPGKPLAFALGLALMICLGVAVVIVPQRLRRVTGRWLLPGTIHAGDDITVGAQLQAADGSGPVSLGAWDPNQDAIDFVTDLSGLGPQPTRVAWVARFPRRGVITLPPLVVRNEQPFGVLCAQRLIGDSATITVRPAIGQVERDIIEQLRRWLDAGATSVEQGDDDIAYLRNYRQGDPLRTINWRASARARTLLVTRRQAPACHRLAILLDVRGKHRRSKRFEQLVSITATLIDHLSQLGWSIVLHGAFAPSGGIHGDRERLLDALATIEADATSKPEDHLPRNEPVLVLTTDHRDSFASDERVLVLDLEQAKASIRIPRVTA